MGKVLLSATYLGPVQWYQKLHRYGTVIDGHESFGKQTYRNRCLIATTNGIQALTIPVEHGGSRCMRDIRISSHGNWQRLHWQALQSAYGESPFFEYYADDLLPFYEKSWDFLYDYDMQLTSLMCSLLDLRPDMAEATRYMTGDEWTSAGGTDMRDAISPKKPLPDPDFEVRQYYQVYQGKWGFVPNLSIVDLLFNEGNEAILYL